MLKGLIFISIAFQIAACGGGRNRTAPIEALEGNAAMVRVRSGASSLPIFLHEGQLYLLGEEGLAYEICIGNHSGNPFEAVTSVDGRDVVSGRVADFRQDRGYVILPGEEVCIEGFRQSMNQVAAFEFTSRDASYAARMGDDTNVGVIGVAIFDGATEQAPVAIAEEAPGAAKSAAQPAPSAARMMDEDLAAEAEGEHQIGTGYGGAMDSAAEMVTFRRRSPESPLELFSMFYDDREGLEAAGIEVPREIALPARRATPNPFPGSNPTQFAPPPAE